VKSLDSESLQHDLDEIGHVIHALKHGNHKHSAHHKSPAREELDEDEEEKRMHELERQRAIKRDLKARDPKHKVELKINSRREYEAGTDGQPVPMLTVRVQGAHGPERIPLVDVRTVRSRCKRLENNCSVKSLLNDQKHHDEEELYAELHMSTAGSQLHDVQMPTQSGYKEKCQQVRMQKRALHVDAMLHKLNSMRTECPDEVLHRYEAQSVKQSDTIADPTPQQRRASTRRTMCFADGPTGNSSDGLTSAIAYAKSKRTRGRATCPPSFFQDKKRQLKLDARRRWSLLRGVVNVFMVYLLQLKRTRAIAIVHDVISQFGEATRVRFAMQKMLSDVKKLQRAARNFLGLKHHRLQVITTEWKEREHAHLIKFYRYYAELVVEEAKAQANKARHRTFARKDVANQQDLYDMIQHETGLDSHRTAGSHSLADNTIDWKPYRIPAAERRSRISKYYMVQLRRHVRSKANMEGVVKKELAEELDMVKFLASFGADVSHHLREIEFQSESKKQADAAAHAIRWWHPSEQTILNLIALAARDLLLANILPFRDHPSRKHLKENAMYCGNDDALRVLEQHMFCPRGDIQAMMPVIQEVDEDAAFDKPMNSIDDVYEKFLPRSQKQRLF
jgi:hypothetical protein